MAKGPDVVLATPTTGWSFHDPRKRIGRLMPVSQSIPLSKSPRKVRLTVIESVGSGVLGSSTRKPAVSRWVRCSSVTWMEFCQLKAPNRSGVSKLKAVMRPLPVCSTVSTPPLASSLSRGSTGVLELVLLVKLSPGDQVMLDPSAMEAGEIVSAGSSCCTLPSERLCRRFPPSVTVPQP
jgi:hypothetical protein